MAFYDNRRLPISKPYEQEAIVRPKEVHRSKRVLSRFRKLFRAQNQYTLRCYPTLCSSKAVSRGPPSQQINECDTQTLSSVGFQSFRLHLSSDSRTAEPLEF